MNIFLKPGVLFLPPRLLYKTCQVHPCHTTMYLLSMLPAIVSDSTCHLLTSHVPSSPDSWHVWHTVSHCDRYSVQGCSAPSALPPTTHVLDGSCPVPVCFPLIFSSWCFHLFLIRNNDTLCQTFPLCLYPTHFRVDDYSVFVFLQNSQYAPLWSCCPWM